MMIVLMLRQFSVFVMWWNSMWLFVMIFLVLLYWFELCCGQLQYRQFGGSIVCMFVFYSIVCVVSLICENRCLELQFGKQNIVFELMVVDFGLWMIGMILLFLMFSSVCVVFFGRLFGIFLLMKWIICLIIGGLLVVVGGCCVCFVMIFFSMLFVKCCILQLMFIIMLCVMLIVCGLVVFRKNMFVVLLVLNFFLFILCNRLCMFIVMLLKLIFIGYGVVYLWYIVQWLVMLLNLFQCLIDMLWCVCFLYRNVLIKSDVVRILLCGLYSRFVCGMWVVYIGLYLLQCRQFFIELVIVLMLDCCMISDLQFISLKFGVYVLCRLVLLSSLFLLKWLFGLMCCLYVWNLVILLLVRNLSFVMLILCLLEIMLLSECVSVMMWVIDVCVFCSILQLLELIGMLVWMLLLFVCMCSVMNMWLCSMCLWIVCVLLRICLNVLLLKIVCSFVWIFCFYEMWIVWFCVMWNMVVFGCLFV